MKLLAKFFVVAIVPFLVIAIPLYMGFLWFGYGFGCGLGLGHNFDCRVFPSTLFFGAIAAFIFGVIFIVNLYKRNAFVRKVVLVGFVISVAVPWMLSVAYFSVSDSVRLARFEGITPSACAAGKPSVPWGRYLSSDQCYYALDMCDKINDSYLQRNCYFDTVGSLKPGKIATVEGCSILKDHYGKLGCEIAFAAERKDSKYCEGVTDAKDSEAIAFRTQCFGKVADAGNMQMYAIDNKHNPGACNSFGGLKKDVCLFWMMEYADGGNSYCKSIVLPTYKQDCEKYYRIIHSL